MGNFSQISFGRKTSESQIINLQNFAKFRMKNIYSNEYNTQQKALINQNNIINIQ